jgi:OHCU decarboxylase
MTLDDINACDRANFSQRVGWVFEHSPWVAERAWMKRPFATLDALHAAMMSAVAAASRDEQLALLRAHPDLGARAAMSDASATEQTGAGLDRLTPEEFASLIRLNAAYREKFGFPFIYAVRGSTKQAILDALEARLSAGSDQELAEALGQVARIARFRLQELIA